MRDWMTAIFYPGVVPIDAPSRIPRPGEGVAPNTAHGTLLDMDEDFSPPLVPRLANAAFGPQGTLYHFPTTSAGRHHQRAWRTVGWRNVTISGEVRIPNDGFRENNAAGPHTPWLPVSYVLTDQSVDDRLMSDSTRIVTPTPSPVARAGIGDGALVTNAGMVDTLGQWQLAGLDGPAGTQETVVSTIEAWTADGITSRGNFDVILRTAISTSGNSSLLRFKRDEIWNYVSIFYFTLTADLVMSDSWDYDGILTAPDGTHNPDETIGPGLNTLQQSLISTDGARLVFVGPEGEAGYVSMESPYDFDLINPKIYKPLIGMPGMPETMYAVPWEENSHSANTVAITEFRDFRVEFTNPVYSILPDPLQPI